MPVKLSGKGVETCCHYVGLCWKYDEEEKAKKMSVVFHLANIAPELDHEHYVLKYFGCLSFQSLRSEYRAESVAQQTEFLSK